MLFVLVTVVLDRPATHQGSGIRLRGRPVPKLVITSVVDGLGQRNFTVEIILNMSFDRMLLPLSNIRI